MLDLVKDFQKYEKQILQYVRDRVDTYYSSECYAKLSNRYISLRDAIDMRAHTGRNRNFARNVWFSKYTFPLVRQSFLLRRSSTKQNFRNDPLVTVEPAGATPWQSAQNMQDVLNQSLKSTKFRSIAFQHVINLAAMCGVSVTYSTWSQDEKKFKKTVSDPIMGYQRIENKTPRHNVKNWVIHPLNYFQNPAINEPSDSDYRGHIQRWPLDKLMSEAQSQEDRGYIRQNLVKVIKEAQESIVKNNRYYQAGGIEDPNAHTVDINHWTGTVNIKGNEDDGSNWYIEYAGDHIIRILENPHDEDIKPYSIFRYDIRPDYWWGNVDTEAQLPLELYLNIIMGMKGDNVIRNLEQYIFYDKSALNAADINMRHKSGGWIPVTLKNSQTLQNLIYGYQGRDISGGDVEYIAREIKEISQRMSSSVDLQRNSNQGGLANNTATAAMMIQESGNQVEMDYLEQFSYGLVNMGEINCIMLQQYAADTFAIRPDIKKDQKILQKSEILGSYAYNVSSSMTKNKAYEAMRLQNVLTAIINFAGSGNPAFQQINPVPIVRDWLRKLDLPGDIDSIYSDQVEMQQPGAMPGLPVPGQEMGGAMQPVKPTPLAPEAQPYEVSQQVVGI